jgi:hypothetical protein
MSRMPFEQRKAQLEGLLRRGDMEGIMEIYLGPMLGGGIMVQPGTLASTMIAEILKREYPDHPQD